MKPTGATKDDDELDRINELLDTFKYAKDVDESVAARLQIKSMISERERLREALRACQFELLTMIPRVTPQYRKNLQAAVDLAKTVLDATPSTSAGGG